MDKQIILISESNDPNTKHLCLKESKTFCNRDLQGEFTKSELFIVNDWPKLKDEICPHCFAQLYSNFFYFSNNYFCKERPKCNELRNKIAQMCTDEVEKMCKKLK